MLANRSMPLSTVIPVIGYPDVSEATAWLCAAFGFSLRLRIGDHRAQLNVGDGAVVVAHGRSPAKGELAADDGPACSVMVRVTDVDAHCDRARQFGARILHPPTDYPYGERQYTAMDFAGRGWTFSQTLADVDPTEWGGTPGQI